MLSLPIKLCLLYTPLYMFLCNQYFYLKIEEENGIFLNLSLKKGNEVGMRMVPTPKAWYQTQKLGTRPKCFGMGSFIFNFHLLCKISRIHLNNIGNQVG